MEVNQKAEWVGRNSLLLACSVSDILRWFERMGVQGLLLIGFAPIAWIFSQSTSSPSFMGFLYLVMLLVSAGFGLALTGRVLAATGTRARILWIWNMMFVVVMLQLTTNMRPIVGKFEGVGIAEKEFFLSHWGRSLSDEM